MLDYLEIAVRKERKGKERKAKERKGTGRERKGRCGIFRKMSFPSQVCLMAQARLPQLRLVVSRHDAPDVDVLGASPKGRVCTPFGVGKVRQKAKAPRFMGDSPKSHPWKVSTLQGLHPASYNTD